MAALTYNVDENLKKDPLTVWSSASGQHPLNMNDSAGLTNRHPDLERAQDRI